MCHDMQCVSNIHSCLCKEQFEWLKIMIRETWYDRNRDRAVILFDSRYQSALSIRTCTRLNFLRRFNEPDSDTRPREEEKRGCLRPEELLSNCCPARPLLTKPPIKHYRGYQEAVDHFHGFARATLIQHALILQSYILAWYVLMHGIIMIQRATHGLSSRACFPTRAKIFEKV